MFADSSIGALVFATSRLHSDPVQEVLETLTTYLATLPAKRLVTLGYYAHEGAWLATAETRNRPKVTFAMDYAVRNILHLHDVFAARVGHGVARFPAHEAVHRSLIVWWRTNFQDLHTHEYDGAPAVQTHEIAGPSWPNMHYIQLLMAHPGSDIPPLTQLAQPGVLDSHGSEEGDDTSHRPSETGT